MLYEYELNLDDATAEARHLFRVGPYAERLQSTVKKILRTRKISGLFVTSMVAIWFAAKYLSVGISGILAEPVILVFQVFVILFFGKMFVQSMIPGAVQKVTDKLVTKSCMETPSHRLLGWRALHLTEDQFLLNSEYVDDVIRPGAIDRIDDSDTHLYITLASGLVLSLPKRSQTSSTIEELKSMLVAWSGQEIQFIPA